MQQRRNKSRLILLAVLTTLALIVFWWIQPENRLDLREDLFQVKDLSSINRVTLQSDNANISLSYDGSQWRLNDSLAVDRDMISVLFATLQQARPKRAVAQSSQDSIFRELKTSGVTVSLYEGEALREQFIAGGNRAKTQAYFAAPGTGEVYVMAIPGYRVYVSGILELDANGWRDKFVFNFNWRNFKRLEMRWPDEPSENFAVSMQKDFFGIEGMAAADTSKLNTFLDDVSLLTVDAYLSEPGLSDSLQSLQPQFDLRVSDIANRTYRLRVFDPGASGPVFALLQQDQAAVFDRRKIMQLSRQKSFFLKK